MVIKGTGKMGNTSIKICTVLGLMILTLFSAVMMADNASQLQNAESKAFITPKFNEVTNKLEYILTGENGETVGTLLKIDDARLEIIGNDGKSIDIVITSPEAFYDRVADYIKGDKDVHYRSLKMDGDGVGFRMSNVNKTLHILHDVKLIIYPDKTVEAEEAAGKNGISNQDEADTQVKIPILENEIGTYIENDSSLNEGLIHLNRTPEQIERMSE